MKEKSNTQKVLKGISSQTLVTIGMGVVEILYFSIMSRLLSREDFGLFAVITAVTAIFFSISEAGIGSALIQRKDMSDDYKNTAFTLSFIIGFLVSLVMAALSDPIARLIVGEELKIPLMLMSITIFFNGLISINISWMERHLQFLKAGVVKLIAFLSSSVIAIIMAIYGYGIYAILFKAIAGSLFALVISYFFVGTSFKFKFVRTYFNSIIQFGGWLTISVIIHNISSQIDRLLMSRLISVESLGAYNRPKEFIIQIGTRINGIFDTALFPVLSSIQDNYSSLRNAFNQSMYIMNLCSMGLTLTFVCNAEIIIKIFFGNEWLDLKPLFQILSLTLLFNINGRLGDCYLRSLGFVRQQFNLRFFELFLDIACILIGFHFGIMGVAVGFLIANVILIGIKTFYIAWKLQISNRDILHNVLGGWAYGVYFIPLIIIQYIIEMNEWFYNILSLFLFASMMLLLFVLCPCLVGKQYKECFYYKVKAFVTKK